MKKKEIESKKMNPIWVVLVFVVLAVVIIYKINVTNKANTYKLEEIYQAHSKDVDSATQELLNHPGFEGLSKADKVADMGKLLAIYEQTGVITNVFYSGDDHMYTFTYNLEPITGALGGVSLKEWNPYMN